jgi:S-DNA-T family DNA segregation ATPase FtsK/SpoIIIE
VTGAPETSPVGPQEDEAVVLVDPRVDEDAPGAPPGPRGRRPLVPKWLRDPATARSAARWWVADLVHALAFHALRAPVYYLRLSALAPVGVLRLFAVWWTWALDVPGREVHRAVTAGVVGSRRAVLGAGGVASSVVGAASSAIGGTVVDLAARRGWGAGPDPAVGMAGRLEAETYLRVSAQHRNAVRGRLAASAVVAGVTAPLLAVLVAGLSTSDRAVVAAVALPLLGMAGRRPDQPIASRATDSSSVPRLTSDLILTALGSLGIAELNKNLKPTAGGAALSAAGVRFPGPITRDGPGWRADVDLPPGVTAGDVIERRDRLASGLRRPLGCVWPEVDPDVHAGRLVLWVGDRPLAEGKPVAWPLTRTGRANVFVAVPLGLNQRGRPVQITLMFAAGVIGAIPRMGKTVVLRLIALAGALDPRVELHAYNLKGGADLDPLAKVAHAYRAGDDDADLEYLARDLRALAADRRRRYATLRALPREVCPESKVTDALASRPDLRLHPVLVVIDECQLAFEHPTYGSEITALVTDLVKAGPAVGIMVWCATQRADNRSLPRDVSANAVLRIALKLGGQVENDMVLGTSAYRNGTRATMLSRRDRGVAILAGEHDDPTLVRIAYVDGPSAETIAARARAARKVAGLLTGHAAGVDLDDGDRDGVPVLEHVLEVWPAEQPAAWCDELAQLLATTWPGRYDGWGGEQVTAAVKAHGLTPRQVKRTNDGRQTNKRGLRRADVERAHAAHRARHGDPERAVDATDGDRQQTDRSNALPVAAPLPPPNPR